MNLAELELDSFHDGMPPFLKIFADNKIIFEGLATDNLKIKFDYPFIDRFIVKIQKTGKIKKVVDNFFKQEIIVRSLKLNGCNVHPDKFGTFSQFGNPYCKDTDIQTDKLFLNGDWLIDIPIFDYSVNQSVLDKHVFRDKVEDSDIACFGCSFTYGANLEKHQTWPFFLSQILNNKLVKNYGKCGNSIQEIMSTALDYAKKYDAKSLICLLPHPCRMQIVDPDTNDVVTLLPGRSPSIERKFSQLSKKIALYGEVSLLFAGYVKYLKDIINKINSAGKKIYISCYDYDFYQTLKLLELDKIFLLPYYERDKNYPCTTDDGHPGEIHNRLFAENAVKYVL